MRLLFITASGRAIAESASCAGFSFYVIDQFADWDLRQICSQSGPHTKNWRKIGDFSEALEPIDWRQFDASIIAGGFEHRLELVRILESRVRVLGTGSRQLSRLQDVSELPELAKIIHLSGGRFPEHRLNLTGADFVEKRWLRKRLDRSGGTHVRPANPLEKERAEESKSGSSAGYIQELIVGSHYSAVFVAGSAGRKSTSSIPSKSMTTKADKTTQNSAACRLIGISRQLVGEPQLGASTFSYCGSIGPLNATETTRKTLANIGSSIAREFEIEGIFGIDYIENSTGIWLVDINPRIPASAELYELAASGEGPDKSFSIVRNHVSACLGEKITYSPIKLKNEMIGKAVLFYQNPAEIEIDKSKFERLIAINQRSNSMPRPQDWLADIPTVGTTIKAGEPVVSLFVRGFKEREIYDRLLAFAVQIREHLGA